MLVLSATACSSDSDSTTESLPGALVEDTAGSTDTATTQTPPADTDTTGDATVTTDAGNTDKEPAPTEPVVVPAALQFTAPLVGGGTFDGAAVAGKPTVFWFWAPT